MKNIIRPEKKSKNSAKGKGEMEIVIITVSGFILSGYFRTHVLAGMNLSSGSELITPKPIVNKEDERCIT